MLSPSVISGSLPWTVAHQAPLSMGFSREEYWSGLQFPPLGDLPNPRIEPSSPAWVIGFFTTGPPGKSLDRMIPFVKTKQNKKRIYMEFLA